SAVWGDLGAAWPSYPSARHDLLHLYNSDATPLPTLRVEVWRSALRVLDDLLGYASINMAPLLARPGSTSERWHVLSNPKDDPSRSNPDLASGPIATTQGSLPSAGIVLLSMGFTPTGTPSVRSASLSVPPPPISGNGARNDPGESKSSGEFWESSANSGGGCRSYRSVKAAAPVVAPTSERPSGGRTRGHVSDEKQDPVVVAMGEAGDKTSGNDERRRFDIGGQNGSPLPEVDRVEGVWGGVVGGAAGGGLTAAAAGGVDVRGDEVKEVDDDGVDEGGGRVHLFRVKSYTAPVWCEVCRRMLFGVRNQGFCCEACSMNVHARCQLRANFLHPCPGRGKERREQGGNKVGSSKNVSRRSSSRELDQAVGLLQIHLRSAHRCGPSCRGAHCIAGQSTETVAELQRKPRTGTYHTANGSAAPSLFPTVAATGTLTRSGEGSDRGFLTGVDGAGIVSPGGRQLLPSGGRPGRQQHSHGYFTGDHYCRVRVGRKGAAAGAVEVVRTEAVFQTHDPLFDKTWVFVAPSYDSLISVDLVDASTDKSVGVFETSVIALLQAEYDARAVGHKSPSEQLRNRRLLAPGAAEDEENVTGILEMRLEFDEDTEAFFGPNGIVGPAGNKALRKVPSRQHADVSVETLKSLVARVKGIIRWYIIAKNGLVMSWENTALSSISLVVFVYLCLVANAEYILALLPFSLLVFMTWGYLQRRSGAYVQGWISGESTSVGGVKDHHAGFR
ncbi:unnamed protein product, partial [Sphacelaria rigidula]